MSNLNYISVQRKQDQLLKGWAWDKGLGELNPQERLEWVEEMRYDIHKAEYQLSEKDRRKPCILWGDLTFTVQEAKRRCTELEENFLEDEILWCLIWEKVPRRILRARKQAPPKIRLKAYLKGCFKKRCKGGAWMKVPTVSEIAKALSLSESTIKRAFQELEDEEDMKFRSANSQKGRGRVRYVALSSWLKHDKEPLLFTDEGKDRGIRTSFRPEGEVILTALKYPVPKSKPRKEKTTKVQKCLSYTSIRDNKLSQLSENKPQSGWLEPLARKIIEGKTMDSEKPERPHTPRLLDVLDVDKLAFNAVLHLLRDGYWRTDALKIVYRSLRETDTAIADEMPRNAQRYFWGILRQKKEKYQKPTRKELNSERSRFWGDLSVQYSALAEDWKATAQDKESLDMIADYESKADKLREKSLALSA